VEPAETAAPMPKTAETAETVELTVPATASYVSVLRTVTASLAARRDFTIDEIDDLRIAVDEASALLLPHAGTGARLSAEFDGSATALRVSVSLSGLTDAGAITLDETSFAWLVLSALADHVSTATAGDRLSVTLSKARSARA
jgi:serine/threonine-protein kinase RsbW